MKKNILFSIIILLLITFVFVLAEIGIRFYHLKAKNISFSKSLADYYDPLFGWEGKKIFGDQQSSRKKILVVGDSYTDGVGADERKMYYRALSQGLGAELFIYGGPGYGTLQEYLVIDKYFDEIKPDLVVLQVCFNDFYNNSWKLEKASFSNNNLLVRPYLINGKIKYYYPRMFGKYRIFLSKHSRLLYMFFNGVDMMLAQLSRKNIFPTVEKAILRDGLKHKGFERSVKTTSNIIRKIKNRTGKIPIVTVAVDTKQPFEKQFQNIFADHSIPFITKPARQVEMLDSKDVILEADNYGHFNELANQLFGKVLLDEIKILIDQGVVKY